MPLPLLPSCLQESINLPVLPAHFPAGGPRACHASCLLPLDDARLVPEKELLLQTVHCCSVTHTPCSDIDSTSILSKPFQYRSITSKTSKLLVCPQHGMLSRGTASLTLLQTSRLVQNSSRLRGYQYSLSPPLPNTITLLTGRNGRAEHFLDDAWLLGDLGMVVTDGPWSLTRCAMMAKA